MSAHVKQQKKRLGLTKAEVARRLGLTRAAVGQRVKAGILPVLEDGTLDPEVVEREWGVLRRGETGEPEPAPLKGRARKPRGAQMGTGAENADVKAATVPGAYAQSRMVRELYRAKSAQLDFERESGTLVRAEEVEARWFELARALQTRMLAIPGRLADELASVTEPHVIRHRIDAEIRSALQELARAATTPGVREDAAKGT